MAIQGTGSGFARAARTVAAYDEHMRRRGGAIAEVTTAVLVVGIVAASLVLYNADKRDRAGRAAFDAAVTRASSRNVPLSSHDLRLGAVELYPVIDDGTLHPLPTGTPLDMWSAFLRMVTPEFAAEHVTVLRIAHAPDSPVTAAVARAAVRPARWTLTVNVANVPDRSAYLRTLVHEYAHLLTLGDGEVDSSAAWCPTTELREGCLLADSTLERFKERFWTAYGDDAPPPDSASATVAWRHYLEHNDEFIGVYAARNVVEDAAETFTEFVIRDRPNPESGPWALKILFFWSYPEYVAIRAHIREWFLDELPEPALPDRWTAEPLLTR